MYNAGIEVRKDGTTRDVHSGEVIGTWPLPKRGFAEYASSPTRGHAATEDGFQPALCKAPILANGEGLSTRIPMKTTRPTNVCLRAFRARVALYIARRRDTSCSSIPGKAA